MNEFPKVNAHWDDQPGVTPGWYVAIIDEGNQTTDDSAKFGFCVETENYRREDRQALIDDLATNFPDHEIYVRE